MIAKIFALAAAFGWVLPVSAVMVGDAQLPGSTTMPAQSAAPATSSGPLPGTPPVIDPANIYSETAPGKFSPATSGALARVYVPEHGGDMISVIDPVTMTVVDHYAIGLSPQHVVPAYDLKTLWVTNNNDFHRRGGSSLTPIDPQTGKAGKPVEVTDAYNMYFMPDGSAAIVINEAQRRLDFRDPQTMKLLYSIDTPGCYGINHADFAADGSYGMFSCEFGGGIAKVDLITRKMLGVLPLKLPAEIQSKPRASLEDELRNQICTAADDGGRVLAQDELDVAPSPEPVPNQSVARPVPARVEGVQALPQVEDIRYARRRHRGGGGGSGHGGVFFGHGMSGRGMPQDVRLSPDGKTFYVADMIADGIYMVDGVSFTMTGFIPTGPGAHGFCVSRDGKKLYISNRGSHAMPSGSPHGPGSVAVLDFASGKIEATWPIPGGGSPDMGSVSADGKMLWFSGRFDNEVYAIATDTGVVTKIKVGSEPHGLTVWPQPGRFSLGHTGNMR